MSGGCADFILALLVISVFLFRSVCRSVSPASQRLPLQRPRSGNGLVSGMQASRGFHQSPLVACLPPFVAMQREMGRTAVQQNRIFFGQQATNIGEGSPRPNHYTVAGCTYRASKGRGRANEMAPRWLAVQCTCDNNHTKKTNVNTPGAPQTHAHTQRYLYNVANMQPKKVQRKKNS